MATTPTSLFTFNLAPGSVNMAQPAPAQQSPSPLMANNNMDSFTRSKPDNSKAFFLPATRDNNTN
jgi:hypothetical protein